jgi:hypothetical protein
MTLSGQCLCGNITYTCDAEPESMTYCHCDTCRRITGSAFNIGVGIPKEALKVSGNIKRHTHTNGSTREFCPTCGSPLFTIGSQTVWIRAGSLDNAEALQPTRQMWTELSVPWAHIPTGISSYPQHASSTDGNVTG